jgi:hypothetical protein
MLCGRVHMHDRRPVQDGLPNMEGCDIRGTRQVRSGPARAPPRGAEPRTEPKPAQAALLVAYVAEAVDGMMFFIVFAVLPLYASDHGFSQVCEPRHTPRRAPRPRRCESRSRVAVAAEWRRSRLTRAGRAAQVQIGVLVSIHPFAHFIVLVRGAAPGPCRACPRGRSQSNARSSHVWLCSSSWAPRSTARATADPT